MAKSKFTYEYERPSVTVDVIAYTILEGELRVLLIRRGDDPFAGRWALPGGFVEPNEKLEAAAKRELNEETGLSVGKLWPLGAYGDPGRDPRGWTVSAAFLAVVAPSKSKVVGSDDAVDAAWKPADRLPPLAFDHRKILADAREHFVRLLYTADVVAPLLPKHPVDDDFYAVVRLIDPNGTEMAKAMDEVVKKIDA